MKEYDLESPYHRRPWIKPWLNQGDDKVKIPEENDGSPANE